MEIALAVKTRTEENTAGIFTPDMKQSQLQLTSK
jgi:hypothetical protein